MKKFKSLTAFKKSIQVGSLLKIRRRGELLPIKTMVIARSTCFAVEFERDGKTFNSWMDYPSAKECEIENETKLIMPCQWFGGNPAINTMEIEIIK